MKNETKRSLSKLMTTQTEVVALDRTSYAAMLALRLELIYKGKENVAKVRLAEPAPLSH